MKRIENFIKAAVIISFWSLVGCNEIVHAENTSRHVIIDGKDYANSFSTLGVSTISGDLATLTPDEASAVGTTALNTKIDMNESFTLKGSVNLGSKSADQEGADGIGFVFLPEDTGKVGDAGNSFGIGGIPNCYGFKLDSCYNPDTQANAYPDPPQFATSDDGERAAFGAYIYTGEEGKVTTISEDSQQVPQPQNNQFLPIVISYEGATKTLSVNYNGIVWSRKMDFEQGVSNMSFAVTASTGAGYNLQQFQLESFDYTIAQGKVTTCYVDELGNSIAPTVVQTGDVNTPYTTKKRTFPNYSFKEVQGNSSGTFLVDDQTVTYVYKGILGLSVPDEIDFGSYQLGTSNSALAYPQDSPVTVTNTTGKGWTLSASLEKIDSDFSNYLMNGSEKLSDNATLGTSTSVSDITTVVSSSWKDKTGLWVDYSTGNTVRDDSEVLVWTLTPDVETGVKE